MFTVASCNVQADARPLCIIPGVYVPGQDGNDTGRSCMFKHLLLHDTIQVQRVPMCQYLAYGTAVTSEQCQYLHQAFIVMGCHKTAEMTSCFCVILSHKTHLL